MSFTVVEADAPPAVIVSVSEPSVSTSLTKVIEIVAKPLELITALPLRAPSKRSAELMPLKLYGIIVLEGILVVVSVNVAVNPSFTD